MPEGGSRFEREVVFHRREPVGVPNLRWEIWWGEHVQTRGFRAEKPPNGQQKDMEGNGKLSTGEGWRRIGKVESWRKTTRWEWWLNGAS